MRDEEKKVYSVVGKVEIGTDEYRDLVEGLAQARSEVEKADRCRWDTYREKEKIESELKKVQAERDSLTEYLKSAGKLAEYVLWSTGYEEED